MKTGEIAVIFSLFLRFTPLLFYETILEKTQHTTTSIISEGFVFMAMAFRIRAFILRFTSAKLLCWTMEVIRTTEA